MRAALWDGMKAGQEERRASCGAARPISLSSISTRVALNARRLAEAWALRAELIR